jgi:hypothetical protein
VAIARHLQGDDVHAVELHVLHPRKTHLLLRRDLKHLDLGVARALAVEMDELRGPSMVSIDRSDSSVHHDLHGVAVSRITGGVRHDPLDRRLEVREELLGRLPLDAERPPPGEKAHLGLGVRWGHPALVKDNVDLVLRPLDVGVDGEAPGGVHEEARRRGAMLLRWGRGVHVDWLLLPRRLRPPLLLGGRLCLGGPYLRHGGVVIVVLVVGGVVFDLVVVNVVVVNVVVVNVVPFVLCNFRMGEKGWGK